MVKRRGVVWWTLLAQSGRGCGTRCRPGSQLMDEQQQRLPCSHAFLACHPHESQSKPVKVEAAKRQPSRSLVVHPWRTICSEDPSETQLPFPGIRAACTLEKTRYNCVPLASRFHRVGRVAIETFISCGLCALLPEASAF